MGWLNSLLWPRRCTACGKLLGVRRWVVETAYVIGSIWLWLDPPRTLEWWGGMLILGYFGLIVVIDIEHRLILHPVSLAGAIVGSVIGYWLHGWSSTVIGGLAGFLGMLILYAGGNLVMRWLARLRGYALEEEALGFGDVILGGVLGLFLGWPGILIGLMLTIVLAGAWGAVLMAVAQIQRRYRPDLTFAYGPFLAASALILLIFR